MAKNMVTVAQLVEPRIVIPVVVGSSPISHPILLTGVQIELLINLSVGQSSKKLKNNAREWRNW